MSGLKVFIVEDSTIIRDNLVEALRENTPVDVVGSAADEADALRCLLDEKQDCDLVIVDIFLKTGTGLGVLKALAGMTEPPVRMVFSNHATADVRKKCLQLGASAVFDKSNEIDEMFGWVNRFAQSDREATASRS